MWGYNDKYFVFVILVFFLFLPSVHAACVDNDGDGHGAAYHTDGCTYDIPDCNDSNPTVWQDIAVYPDRDGDNYTSQSEQVIICSNGTAPAGYSVDPGNDCNDNNYFYNPAVENPLDSYLSCSTSEYYLLDPWEFNASSNPNFAQDFAIYYDNISGYLHTFYIRFPAYDPLNLSKSCNQWQSCAANSIDFGHEKATQINLNVWNYVGGILTAAGNGWDNQHVWAPSVIYNLDDNKYYMFYVGVTDSIPNAGQHKERIGIATSRDLNNWNRYAVNKCNGSTGNGCVFDCNFSWTSWSTPGDWHYQCRDPFVFKDDNGYYYMTYSTATAQDVNQMIIGLAKSQDLINWIDLGPINVTKRGKAESSHIFKKNGYYYMFWTSGPSGVTFDSVKYSYTNSLESGNWSVPINVDRANSGMYATEILHIRNGFDLIGYVASGNIYFKRIDINENHNVTITQVGPLTCNYINPFNVHPNALEILNGLDDNCNGVIDESVCIDNDHDGHGINCIAGPDCNDNDPTVWQNLVGYPDIDGDGYYSTTPVSVCSGTNLSFGYSSTPGNDCNDNNNQVWRSVTAYFDADGDGYSGLSTQLLCVGTNLPLHYYWSYGKDCNDNNSAVNPGARELCSTPYDDNCNGLINEGCDKKVKIPIIYEPWPWFNQ